MVLGGIRELKLSFRMIDVVFRFCFLRVGYFYSGSFLFDRVFGEICIFCESYFLDGFLEGYKKYLYYVNDSGECLL